MRRTNQGAILAAAVAAFAMLGSACGPGTNTGSTTCSATGSFTAAEVAAGSAPHAVVPVYDVPKCLKKKYVLAFVNPGQSFPFFKSWHDGYTAAAKFYGVTLIESDVNLKFDDLLSSYQTLSVKHPDVVGTLPVNGAGLFAQTKADGVPLLNIDIPVEGDPYYMGVPNEKAGRLAGDALATAAQSKMSGDWQGRNLIAVGVTQFNTPTAVTRTGSGTAEIKSKLKLTDRQVFSVDQGTTSDQVSGQKFMTDFLTAHPHDVMLAVVENDEAGAGALQAINQAGRAKDVLMVYLGGDDLGRATLRGDKNGVVTGVVDFNPYAEGWTWVEIAIAIKEGGTYQAYDVNNVLTKENVNQLYPNDPK